MKLYIEGYRTQNHKLWNILTVASYYFCATLLSRRMATNSNLEVDIKLTKGLKKKEGAYGFCHITDDDLNKPREFMIELDASMDNSIEQVVTWLAHEFVHLKQFVRGELFDYEFGATQWKAKKYTLNKISYHKQPWEREAYRLETKLTKEFMEIYNE